MDKSEDNPNVYASQSLVELAFQEHAQDGLVPFDQLQAVLSISGIPVTSEQLCSAIVTIRGDRGDDLNGVSFTLNEVLTIAQTVASIPPGEETDEDECRPSLGSHLPHHSISAKHSIVACCKAMCHHLRSSLEFRRNRQGGFASGMKPTSRLTLLVVVLSFVMALAVAGMAIGLSWTASMSARKDSLHKELDLVLNAAEAFTVTQFRKREEASLKGTAVMVAEIMEHFGYDLNLDTVKYTQLRATQVAARIIDHSNDISTKSKMVLMARNLGGMLNQMCVATAANPDAILSTLTNIVNGINWNELPADHEVILATKSGPNITPLNDLRFMKECPVGQTCHLVTGTSSMYSKALNEGRSDEWFIGTNYLSQPIYGGYHLLTQCGTQPMVLVYQVRTSSLQNEFLAQAVDVLNTVNSKYDFNVEVMIQQDPGVPLTSKRYASQCATPNCSIDHVGALAVSGMLSGGVPTGIGKDYRDTIDVIAAAASLISMNGTLVLEIDVDDVLRDIHTPIGHAVHDMSQGFEGSMEILIGMQNGTNSVMYFNTPRFAHECPKTGCQYPDPAMKLACIDKQRGIGTMLDYRNKTVLAAYADVDSLGFGLVFKVDEEELTMKSILELTDYIDEQNSLEKTSLELMLGLKNHSAPIGQQLVVLSQLKDVTNPEAKFDAASKFEPMARAIHDEDGFMVSRDYRGNRVMSAYSRSHGLDTGIVIKVDSSEVEQPLIIQIIILMFTAIGIAVVGVAIVGVAANRMLASIEDTWETSKKLVQQQKEGFESLVSALYPKFASDQLLAGESQIVLELSQATIFFSDIVGFSTISNRLSVQELMGWIGYTFGVMDQIATYYSIYKVKTIGDAYFAIAGLPGVIPEHMEDHHTMRMLKFVSAVAQVFSGRFTHPDAGACLAMIASQNKVLRKEQRDALRKKSRQQSMASGSVVSSATSMTSAREGQCDMRYGVARGPVTAGVLPGKCPAFDVWGKTVNLAARMEGTGQPNMIQCSESVYQAATKDPQNPFVFDEPHTTYAKGFGNVSTYFINFTHENPPKDLLTILSIEPALGGHHFKPEMTARKKHEGGGAPNNTRPYGTTMPSFLSQSASMVGAVKPVDPTSFPMIPEVKSTVRDNSSRTVKVNGGVMEGAGFRKESVADSMGMSMSADFEPRNSGGMGNIPTTSSFPLPVQPQKQSPAARATSPLKAWNVEN